MKIFMCGGAVRDKLLGKVPNDYDYVVVGSTPKEMESLGYKQVGKDFPVYLHPLTGEEYALARLERKSGLKHTDFETVFDDTVSIEDDLIRRDLTINAIALDMDTGEYIDPYGGRSDIENKILRHTSKAFGEDPLRILRLARFSARFQDFTIAEETKNLVRDMIANGELDHISQDRIWIETKKALLSDNPFNYFKFLNAIMALQHLTCNEKSTFFDEHALSKVFENTINFEDEHKLLVRTAAFYSYYWYDAANEKDFIKNLEAIKIPTHIIALTTFMGKFADELSMKMANIVTAEKMVDLLDKMNIKGMVAKIPTFLEDIYLLTKVWVSETEANNCDICKFVMEAYLDTKEFLACSVKRHIWIKGTEPNGAEYRDMVHDIRIANVKAAMHRFFYRLEMNITCTGFNLKKG